MSFEFTYYCVSWFEDEYAINGFFLSQARYMKAMGCLSQETELVESLFVFIGPSLLVASHPARDLKDRFGWGCPSMGWKGGGDD
ncbi:hypothetical protein PsorP6_015207 [Peronosclerospora sorghi]|uniref:Uncharacterized protein n=1 Tax=Peronosclerospora sorghi TaxID=230839 RepID=A0ACC0VR25_9STRA|nr:hypothetical protein PsorP6_015207 [Peronosclerospora sorghi]